jgi:DEAD/DEAH box helicase
LRRSTPRPSALKFLEKPPFCAIRFGRLAFYNSGSSTFPDERMKQGILPMNTESIPPSRTVLDRQLREIFGHERFLPGQLEVMEHLMAGRSAVAVFPTGGGKSMCYQLPATLLSGLTLVISPLLALMKDQIDALAARRVPAARLHPVRGPVRTSPAATAPGRVEAAVRRPRAVSQRMRTEN